MTPFDITVSSSVYQFILYITIAWSIIMGIFLLYDKYKFQQDHDSNQPADIEKKRLISRVALGGTIAIVMNADGRPTKAELEEVKSFLKKYYRREYQLEILHHVKRVLALKRPNTDYYVSQLNLSFDYPKRMLIVEMLYEVASFNGGITPEEWRLMSHIMVKLHITNEDQEKFHYRYHTRIGSTRFNNNDVINTTENSLNRCYAALGLQKGASAEDVKRAYRTLVKQYHPDRLGGVTDPEKITLYTRKFREINEAYEELIEVLE